MIVFPARDVASRRSGGFLPSQVSGLVTWVDASAEVADRVTIGAADKVSAWLDRSGNGNAFSQGTGAAQPVYQRSVAGLNGLNAIYFDQSAVSQYLASGTFSPAASSAAEAFAVTKLDADPPAASWATGLWHYGATTNFPWLDGIIYDGFASAGFQTAGNPSPSLASARVYNVSSTSGYWEARLDGASIFSTASNTYSQPVSGSIGGKAGVGIQGWIGEHLLYNRVLTSMERASVVTYLKTKWGIA